MAQIFFPHLRLTHPISLLASRLHYSNWSNEDNINFYNKFFEQELKDPTQPGSMSHFLNQSGLRSCPDMEALMPYVPKGKSNKKILDIGAGIGRTLPLLQQRGYQVTAIERNPTACQLLKQKFGNTVDLHAISAGDFRTRKKFIAVLWLWCGICDFPKEEQALLLNKFLTMTAKGGVLAIDIPKADETNATSVTEGYQEIQLAQVTYKGYVPSDKEISGYLKNRRDYAIKCVSYETDTRKTRNLYLFFKPGHPHYPYCNTPAHFTQLKCSRG